MDVGPVSEVDVAIAKLAESVQGPNAVLIRHTRNVVHWGSGEVARIDCSNGCLGWPCDAVRMAKEVKRLRRIERASKRVTREFGKFWNDENQNLDRLADAMNALRKVQ